MDRIDEKFRYLKEMEITAATIFRNGESRVNEDIEWLFSRVLIKGCCALSVDPDAHSWNSLQNQDFITRKRAAIRCEQQSRPSFHGQVI
jgi:hypothetical protein